MISRKNVLFLFEKVNDKLGRYQRKICPVRAKNDHFRKTAADGRSEFRGGSDALLLVTSDLHNTTANSQIRDGSVHITAIFLDLCTAH